MSVNNYPRIVCADDQIANVQPLSQVLSRYSSRFGVHDDTAHFIILEWVMSSYYIT